MLLSHSSKSARHFVLSEDIVLYWQSVEDLIEANSEASGWIEQSLKVTIEIAGTRLIYIYG